MENPEKPFLIGYSVSGEEKYLHLQSDRQMSRWKRSHHRAALNWITKYRSTQNSSNLVKVKGRLEAFYHYCQTEEWIAAKSIWGLTINKSSNVAFERQLQMWGYYEQSLTINRALLGKFSEDMDRFLLSIVSGIYMQTGQHQQSLESSFSALRICQDLGCKHDIADILLSIGSSYYAMGDVQTAIEYHQQALTINEKFEDRSSIIYCLNALGNDYRSQGHFERARSLLEKASDMTHNSGNLECKALTIVNLGSVYLELKLNKKALKCFQQSLAIRVKRGDRWAEANSLGNLGNAYLSLGDHQKAIRLQSRKLVIAKEIKSLQHQADASLDLGLVYLKLRKYIHCFELFTQSLEMHKSISDIRGAAMSLNSLGQAYLEIETYEEAIRCGDEELIYLKKMNSTFAEAKCLLSIGRALLRTKQYDRAIRCLEQALPILREIDINKYSLASCLSNLGTCYMLSNRYYLAMEYQQQSWQLDYENGSLRGQASSLNGLGVICMDLRQYLRADKFFQLSLEAARQVSDDDGMALAQKNIDKIKLSNRDRRQSRQKRELSLQRFGLYSVFQFYDTPALPFSKNQRIYSTIPDASIKMRNSALN
jgi:tetratricopeptide (TPR) repeat protein